MESTIKAIVSAGLSQHPTVTSVQNVGGAQAPIGIFDSGVGGITVLREMYKQLPNESVIYFADTAHLPYGDRTPAEILQFVRNILTWMAKQNVKMVIMACNTSSALALEGVQAEFPFPILGLLLPGAQAAAQQGKRIGVIATRATVRSLAYTRAILELNPNAKVWEVSCPKFVPLIEQNRLHESVTCQVAQKYLSSLLNHNIDTLVYGCTHYPHLAPVLRDLLPSSVQLLDPASHVVETANRELNLLGLKNPYQPLSTRFYASSTSPQFAQLASQWLGYTPHVETPAVQTVPTIHVIEQISLKAG